ncbi:hypothetical protein [Rhodopila globiformis]|nr:hypothetical protein [Rhodopila globiformis]
MLRLCLKVGRVGWFRRDFATGRLHHHDARWQFEYGPDGDCLPD